MFFFFFNSWGANHCAKNWGCIRGSGGSLPCNVHQVPPVPFWQVQDPLWSEREWHPTHPLGRWRVAANGPNCASPNPSPRLRFVTFVIAPGCLDYLWTADDTFCMFTEETFAHCAISHTRIVLSQAMAGLMNGGLSQLLLSGCPQCLISAFFFSPPSFLLKLGRHVLTASFRQWLLSSTRWSQKVTCRTSSWPPLQLYTLNAQTMQMKGTTLSLGSAQRLIEPKTYDVHRHVVIPAG